MTSDEFSAEYRAGQCLTSEGIRTTLAQETRKGRLVLVHELVTATEPERRRVQTLLRLLVPKDSSQVIGTFEVDGETVVVTKFLLGFTSLLSWLEAAVAESSTTVISTWENPPTMDMEIHDPRHHRRPPVERLVAPALEDTSIRPVLGSLPLGSPAAGPAPTPLSAQSSPSPPAPSVPAPVDEPTGGFTKLFGESSPAAPVMSAAAQAATDQDTNGPVDFTQRFGEPTGGSTVPSPGPSLEAPHGTFGVRAPEPVPSVSPSPSPASQNTPPSDGAPALPAATSPAADEPAAGDFTRLFGDEPSLPSPVSTPPKPPPVRAAPMERATASAPPPVFRRSAASAPPLEEAGPSSIAPLIENSSVPPAPRIRLGALEAPRGADPDSRRDHDAGSGGPASFPPVPFSVPPLVAGPSGRSPARTPQTGGPDLRPAAAPASLATSSDGGYTEVLTPARPPLNSGPSRTQTPTLGQAPQPPRPSYTPLIVGLGVFLVLAAVLVTYFVMSAP